MELDFVFIVTYDCPSCHVELEDRSSGSPAWHRCPRCSRPILPPDHQRRQRNTGWVEEKSAPLSGTFTTGGEEQPFHIGENDLPIRPRSMAPLPEPAGPKASNLRLLLGFGFFASLFLCIFSMLQSNGALATVAGLGSLICLILLFSPAGRVRPE